MTFNVAEFSARVNQLGILKTSNIAVEIFPGANFGLRRFGSVFSDAANNIRFMAEATNIPGVSLATTEIRRHGYGVIEKKPYVPIFTDVNISFRSDKKGDLYNFFQSWMKMIINFDGRGSINSISGLLPNQSMYEIAYKESYICHLVMTILDTNGNEPIKIVLTEAYPIFLGEMAMAWQSTNDYLKIPVRFTFKDWYLESNKITDFNNVNPSLRPDIRPQPFNQPLNQ